MPDDPTILTDPYTTAEQVASVVGPNVDKDVVDFEPYIATAHCMTNRWCPAYDPVKHPDGYQDWELEMIERWLAAHFFAVNGGDPNLIRERAGEVEEEYQNRVIGFGLHQTTYGQTAMRMEWRGLLAALNTKMQTVSRQVPGGVKKLVGGQSLGGGPAPLYPYNATYARWW